MIPLVIHHVNVRPVRIRERHELLGVDAIRVVAYRAVCSCGWRGSSRETVTLARIDGRRHGAEFGALPAGDAPLGVLDP